MGLFSGLEALGFKNTEVKIFSSDDEPKKAAEEEKKKEAPPLKEEDCLFLKSYTCPICDKQFKNLTIKTGKLRSVGQDDDLRPIYKDFEPLKYDAVVCPRCGYAALAKFFTVVMPVQAKKIREKIKPQFKGIELGETTISYDEALTRYKMVLLCDVVGGVKNGRKAYTCLKMGWLIRSRLQNEAEKLSPEEISEMEQDELECMQNAYDGYRLAFSSENFPISGMDETTLTYLCAELAYRLGKYREALQLLANILSNRNVSQRIKDKALNLKEQIREKNEMAKKGNEE